MATKGVSSTGKGNGTATTTGVTTQASGSVFYVGVVVKQTTGSAPAITDSKSNTYTPIGTGITDTGSCTQYRYYSNGTGGATHTVTATLAGKDLAVFLEEGIGAAGPPSSSNGQGNNFTGSLGTGSVTASTGDFICSLFSTAAFNNPVIPGITGFTTTIDQSQTNGTSGAAGASTSVIATSTGSTSATWSDSSGASGETASADVFASSGGIVLGAQTATFSQGTFTANTPAAPVRAAPLPPLLASKALGPFGLGGFALRVPANVQQAANVASLGAQTATFSQGIFSASSTGSAALGAQTATFSQGTFASSAGATATIGAQTATFSQGTFTASGGPLPSITCAGGTFDSLTPMPGLML